MKITIVANAKHLGSIGDDRMTSLRWPEIISIRRRISMVMASLKNSFRFVHLTVCLSLIILASGFRAKTPAEQVVGIWESEEKNLQIEMFEENGNFAGRMVYFKCSSEEIMHTSIDSENPDKTLTNRKLLGLKLVNNLKYQGENVWDNGKIYDPNSGNTFEARIQLTGPNTAIVRGYWKFKWLGRSMVFHRKG